MKRFFKYLFVFLFGILVTKLWYMYTEQKKYQKEEIQVMLNGVQNLSKLVVSQSNYSEMYSFSDTKKYFYDYIQFEKKAIMAVTANVEIGYDLSQLDIQIDSIGKQIIINKIPEEQVNIAPNIKYYDLQQSQFNTFSTEELNTLNEKAIQKIKETVEFTAQQKEAKTRLFEELSKIYQLSKIYEWSVVDNTNSDLLEPIELKD